MGKGGKVKEKEGKKWVSAEGIRILREVERRILAQPKTYRQDEWYCGTAMCIAGHVCFVSGRVDGVSMGGWDGYWPLKGGERCESWAGEAITALGAELAPRSVGGTLKLFGHPGFWPEPFSTQFLQTGPRAYKARARIAVARIEHFIETGE